MGHLCHGTCWRQFLWDVYIQFRVLFLRGSDFRWSRTVQAILVQSPHSHSMPAKQRGHSYGKYHGLRLHAMFCWILLQGYRCLIANSCVTATKSCFGHEILFMHAFAKSADGMSTGKFVNFARDQHNSVCL